MQRSTLLVCFGFLLLAFSEALAPADSPKLIRGVTLDSDIPFIATNNTHAVEQYKDEWEFNRNHLSNRPPSLGLSLSGGGMRSGTFSIGVLHGLAQIGLITNIDVISSVSGGGYAASWYISQNLPHPVDWKLLFNQTNGYQTYLLNHGEVMSHFAATDTAGRHSEYVLNRFVVTALSMPINLFANGVFGWHANVVPLRRIYQNGLDRIFHAVPTKLSRSTDGEIAVEPSHFQARDHEFEELRRGIMVNQLPFVIVNTTAHIQDLPTYEGSQLKNCIFEFTPLRCGSDFFGYEPNFPFSYNRAISISGAAVDSVTLSKGSTERMIASVFNFDWSYFVDNPKISPTARFWRRFAPIPVYPFLGHYQMDKNGDRIFLGDGGDSENLGAYSLVRRFCRSIIIVDAGYDPDYTFDDYKILQRALLTELGVKFVVPRIEDAIGNRHPFDGTHPIMHGTIASFPILQDKYGDIAAFPIPADAQETNITINVAYIKLSLNPKMLTDSCGEETYPPEIVNYYDESKSRISNTARLLGMKDVFPQEITEDLSYTPQQVEAYHELGLLTVTLHEYALLKALGMEQDQKQPKP